MVEDIAQELKKVLNLEQAKDQELVYDARIFFDKKQYTIRIPARLAQVAKVNAKKDAFRFKLVVDRSKKRPTLRVTGELVRGDHGP